MSTCHMPTYAQVLVKSNRALGWGPCLTVWVKVYLLIKEVASYARAWMAACLGG